MTLNWAINGTCVSTSQAPFSSTLSLVVYIFYSFYFNVTTDNMVNELKKLTLLNCSKSPGVSLQTTQLQPKAEAVGNLKHILKEFNNNRVKVSDEDKKRNMAILQDLVLNKFITAMKAVDPLFNELYKDTFYTGSYFEGLKVSDANEFDLNIRLELPFKWEDVQIVYNNVPAGYAQYRITKPLEVLLSRHPKWNIFQKLTSIMDGELLSQKKINEWCQAVGDKALQQNPQEFRNITRARHGPAFTLMIKTNGTTVLDVDLVPVVRLNRYPPSVRKIRQIKPDSMAFIVPKPTGTTATNAVTTLFRISMPVVEREVMDNMGCVKMLIRIFKAIRDNENWKFFASYYIKTVFLWHLESNPMVQYWVEDRLDQIFVAMLKQFIEVLEKKELKHFLFQKYNLIAGINPVTLNNMKQRLALYLDKSQNNLTEFKKLLYGK